jgi:hypothetical protein
MAASKKSRHTTLGNMTANKAVLVTSMYDFSMVFEIFGYYFK